MCGEKDVFIPVQEVLRVSLGALFFSQRRHMRGKDATPQLPGGGIRALPTNTVPTYDREIPSTVRGDHLAVPPLETRRTKHGKKQRQWLHASGIHVCAWPARAMGSHLRCSTGWNV
jgi:hypothetical protein